jgi:hypothetical protein
MELAETLTMNVRSVCKKPERASVVASELFMFTGEGMRRIGGESPSECQARGPGSHLVVMMDLEGRRT